MASSVDKNPKPNHEVPANPPIFTDPIYINPNHEPLTGLQDADPRVRELHQTLPHFGRTPLVSLPNIANEIGIGESGYVLLKDESSRLGLPAFKILGASWATAKAVARKLQVLPEDAYDLEKLAAACRGSGLTLYAATDGNHGRAVARMAKILDLPATIFCPRFIGTEAIHNIRQEKANVQVFDVDYDQTVRIAEKYAIQHPSGNGLLISDTALRSGDQIAQWIVDGYQTMFDEIEEDLLSLTGNQTVTYVVTPVGVGSLAQAVVTHFARAPRQEKPMIITVESENAACLRSSLEAGEMVTVPTGKTICTGMCCGTLSVNSWPLLKKGVNAAVTVNDHEVDIAVKNLRMCGVQAGPCGAATLAALQVLVESRALHIKKNAVIILLCTEKKRWYQLATEHPEGSKPPRRSVSQGSSL